VAKGVLYYETKKARRENDYSNQKKEGLGLLTSRGDFRVKLYALLGNGWREENVICEVSIQRELSLRKYDWKKTDRAACSNCVEPRKKEKESTHSNLELTKVGIKGRGQTTWSEEILPQKVPCSAKFDESPSN